ncbi:hypothetical protein CFK41_10655 [Brachybacterium ginsengisoli]|uniref:ABC transporter substrate-binding protein n=1 Tax=Brachybacterium ginsengisoli TaxID=1331682 RepID=A0A291GYI8_9MICO|nr:extracellular solute-binding protein [Brachybacterium ginsengisoli]ATG55166.1 hypothetical protein CFK41_10655 [Brachybacterium ginsengisoli]
MIDRRTLLRAVGAGATVTIAGGSIVGCTSRAVGEDRDPNTVRLWGLGAADADKEAKVLEAFSEKNPEVTVEVSQVPSNGEGDASSVITAIRGRTGPDLYWLDRFNAPQFASLGLLEPIDDLIEEHEGVSPEEFMAGWIRFATDELQYDGSYYGLPTSTDTRAMYVNMGQVREAGIDPTLFDPRNGPLPYATIWEIDEQFTSQDARGTYERVTWIPWDDQAKLIMWAMGAGVPFYDDASGHMLLDSPEMLDIATMYAGWIERLDFPRMDAFKATYQPPNAPPAQTSFFSDRQLLQITNPGTVRSLAEYKPDMEYAVTHLPVPADGDDPFSWSGGFALSMPKGSSMSKAAWDLMTFYAGPEGQKIIMPPLTAIPTHLETIADPEGWDPRIEFFVQLLDVTMSRPPLPVGTKLWDAMETMQGSLTQASDTPENLVKEAQQYVDPTMQQFVPFSLPDGFGERDPNLELPSR